MAGPRTYDFATYKVTGAAGVTVQRFVQGVAYDSNQNRGIQMPSGAGVDCIGVCEESGSQNDYVGVSYQGVTWVEGDGTVVANSVVGTDANGKATPIVATGTPTVYYALGDCESQNNNGTVQLCKIRLHRRMVTV